MTGPGPNKLIAGNLERGFYGEVPSSEIISGDALAELVDMAKSTTSINSDTPWLKWAYKGKVLFRPKKPIRFVTSWKRLNNRGLVYGEKEIEIGGYLYKVRLMKGISDDFEHAHGGDWGKVCPNSEWNHLMLPIHIRAKDKTWLNPENVEDDVPYWGIDYTDEDLGIGNVRGRCQWCQEKVDGESLERVSRGCIKGVSNAFAMGPSENRTSAGWAPILELLAPLKPPHKILIKKDGEYGYYDDLEFVSLGADLPDADTFNDYGMDDLTIFNTDTHEVVYPMTSDDNHHEVELDLNGEHKDIIKINEVTK